MEIRALYIQAFGGLKDYSLKTGAGATVFYGPNERGKTTLLTFIRAMFYGLGERRGPDNLRERYQPRDGSAMGGTVWFIRDGISYELSRSFGQRKGLDQVTLTDLDHNRKVELQDPDQPGIELFGLSREVFRNSVSVESSGPGLEKSPQTEQKLWETLSDFLVNPDQQVTAAQVEERLRKARLALLSASGKKGEIPTLEQKEAELTEEIRQLQTLLDESARLSEDLETLRERQDEASSGIEALRRDVLLHDYLEDKERQRLAELPQRQLEAMVAEATQLEELLSPYGSDVAGRTAKINNLLATDSELEEKRERLAAIARDTTDTQKLYSKVLLGGGILLLLAAALLLYLSNLAVPAVALAVVLIALGVTLSMFREQLAGKLLSAKHQARTKQEADLKIRRHTFLAELETLGLGDDSPQAFLNRTRELNEDYKSLAKQIQLQSALAEAERETLGPDFGRHLNEQAALLADLGLDPSGQADYRQADQAREAYRRAKAAEESAARELFETRVRLEAMLRHPVSGQPLAPAVRIEELSPELAELRERLDGLRQRHKALILAEETLAASLLELRESLLPMLAQNAGIYLKRLTRGRYDTLHVEDDFTIRMRDSLHGHYYSPEHFSSGTEDQLWLAFRLALTDHLSAGQTLPLLLDDLFMNYDDKRTSEGLALLGTLANQGRQILLFTCHKRIANLSERQADWRVRRLP